MEDPGLPKLLILGVFLLAGWIAHSVGARTHVPRVTLLLLIGVIGGPAVLDVIPPEMEAWFPTVSHLALAMVGFLLGESLVGHGLPNQGVRSPVLLISIGATLAPAVAVFVGVYFMSRDITLALLLGGIATATAPAATVDVVREVGAKGPLTKTLLGVVAIDDAWGVLLFSLALVTAEAIVGQGQPVAELASGLWDIAGAVVLGVGFGLPMALLTGRAKPGEPTLIEASGFVFLCAGTALYLEVSYLLASIVLGATVAKFAKHHTRPFREIEGASEPFLVIFFLLSGYHFEVATLAALGVIGAVYVAARSAGKVIGANLSARAAGSPPVVRERIGWCLLPQAGVALGLALLAAERIPVVGATVLPLTIATTVVFELFGPVLTRWHLGRSGEASPP